MEIGSRLKNARSEHGLTQEQVAEELGVSRQSVSNWENNRAYPDIVSVIKLSDLYSVSLDELLKEDKKMIEHLDDATNEVKSRKWLSKLIEVVGYLLVWALTIIGFWTIMGPTDIMAYTILTMYLALPIATILCSLFIGLDNGWNKFRWLMVLFFGVMFMFAVYGTMHLASHNGEPITFVGVLTSMSFEAFLGGALCSAFGMGIGTLIRVLLSRKTQKQAG